MEQINIPTSHYVFLLFSPPAQDALTTQECAIGQMEGFYIIVGFKSASFARCSLEKKYCSGTDTPLRENKTHGHWHPILSLAWLTNHLRISDRALVWSACWFGLIQVLYMYSACGIARNGLHLTMTVVCKSLKSRPSHPKMSHDLWRERLLCPGDASQNMDMVLVETERTWTFCKVGLSLNAVLAILAMLMHNMVP